MPVLLGQGRAADRRSPLPPQFGPGVRQRDRRHAGTDPREAPRPVLYHPDAERQGPESEPRDGGRDRALRGPPPGGKRSGGGSRRRVDGGGNYLAPQAASTK